MTKTFLKTLYGFYLGGALAALGYSFTTWQYWAVVLPVIIFVTLFNERYI